MICRRCKMDGTSQEVCERCQRITTLEAQLEAREQYIGSLRSQVEAHIERASEMTDELAQLRARCEELATQYADIAALHLADESTVVQLRARVGELEKDAAVVRFAIETPPMEGYSREFCRGWAAYARELEASLDATSPKEPNDG